MWRTTFDKQGANELHKISIHVLHVEDDFRAWTWTRPSASFQSTSSMWRTTSTPYFSGSDRIFQSTSSMWRTTGALGYTKDGLQISIHVLHVEDDYPANCTVIPPTYFNPRPPCGGRREPAEKPGKPDAISIHVLHVEDDLAACRSQTGGHISIHVLHVEDDLGNKGHVLVSLISIHVLHVEDDHT